jgi:type I restriction enzyme M protein
MVIYLCFLQHVIYSLKDDGKDVLDVTTGFLIEKNGIELEIRKKMVDANMLKGVISMPSNIFANTGTNVSVIFLDKSNKSDEIMLIDASNLGEKVKEGKNQKTVLREEEVSRIIEVFLNKTIDDNFSICVGKKEIQDNRYSFSAGQYFDIKIEYIDITEAEFEEKMNRYKSSLSLKFEIGHNLEQVIMEQIGGLKYDI